MWFDIDPLRGSWNLGEGYGGWTKVGVWLVVAIDLIISGLADVVADIEPL